MVLNKRTELSKELILQHVSEYQILQEFWPAGRELKLNGRAIRSPFRTDDDPSLLISIDEMGMVRYKDLGDGNYKGGSVWQFLYHLEGWELKKALIMVDKRFNLGYTNGRTIEITGQRKEVPKEVIYQQKEPTLIQVTTRSPTREELKYWNSYHQDISDLRREHIYCPKTIYRNKKRIDNTLMTFCYWFPSIEKWKLYRPLAPKRTEKTPPNMWKWDNNLGTLQYVENLNDMYGPLGILTKSRKDRLVLRKLTGIEAICNIQNEDPASLNDEVLYKIWQDVGYKVVFADNDKKGKELSWYLTGRGYNHVNVPDILREEGITDVADWVRAYGMKTVRDYLKNKWII